MLKKSKTQTNKIQKRLWQLTKFRTNVFKKNQFKPVFKQLLKLCENIQNHQKILTFKKKKWEPSKNFTQISLKPLKI
jgi:hypothetical protein